ncbi:hypothetical protein BKA70DRAFT_1372481 [Coprinopsis sp. MPI-PUGE-AT-0042]|nr:hypothetical protein BKA70DRAFT_1372481 [Coprinopsis sp. MPI-PUGE-AT-0042]
MIRPLGRLIFGVPSRGRLFNILLLSLIVTGTILVFNTNLRDPVLQWGRATLTFPLSSQAKCSPEDYSNGTWVYRPYTTRPQQLSRTNLLDAGDAIHPPGPNDTQAMSQYSDALKFARYEGCASSREYWWHLGADPKEMWDRFPGVAEWEWVPGKRCRAGSGRWGDGLREWDTQEVIKELVEGGGWLLIGDSVTENHFFSLSCLLYPHVTGHPDYTKLTTAYDRAWPQHLYLNPDSPLISKLSFPSGFNISSTPLVTFRRTDILWLQEELRSMHEELHPEFYSGSDGSPSNFTLFGQEPVWTMSPNEYFGIFNKPLPEGNYATMIVSTAGHWTTGLFYGYATPELYEVSDDPAPLWHYEGLLQFYEEVMSRWVAEMQRMLDEASGKTSARFSSLRGHKRRIILRPYLPGHEDCHKARTPWSEIQPFKGDWWNWKKIWRFNKIFEDLLQDRRAFPNIRYLGIDRPARLRPDAHSATDCLHIMSGAGVLEGWSHYIWHYITREL